MEYTVHRAYRPPSPGLVPFKGTRDELRPGAYLGRNNARADLLVPGDIVACYGPRGAACYYYDPDCRLTGCDRHVVRVDYMSDGWGVIRPLAPA